MICHVVERALAVRNVGKVIVATDDLRILKVVQEAGCEAVMTRSDHHSGTDRIAEVAHLLPEVEIVVNVQGDEPLISPRTIELAIEELTGNEAIGIVTTWEPMVLATDILNPNVVKVVVDEKNRVLYFSRSPVPFPRDAVLKHGTIEAALKDQPALAQCFRKHTGLYVYRRNVLLNIAVWKPSLLETLESLEQLRPLEHGVRIRAIESHKPSIGVDTIEDLQRVRVIVESEFSTVRGQ